MKIKHINICGIHRKQLLKLIALNTSVRKKNLKSMTYTSTFKNLKTIIVIKIKIRAEINETENRKKKKISENRMWFFEKPITLINL